MKKLKVVKRNNYNYILKDSDQKEYDLNLEFYDIDFEVGVDDTLYIQEKLLNEERCLSFGQLNSIYAKRREENDYSDILVINKNDKIYYLARYYG